MRSTIYTDFEKDDCLQYVMNISAEAGERIKIDGVSLQLSSEKEGIMATAKVMIDGKNDFKPVLFETSLGKYTPLGIDFAADAKNYVAEAGEMVTVKWYLKTSSKTNRVRMKDLLVNYSLVPIKSDVETPGDVKTLIVIECASEVAANEAIEKIKSISPGAEIYIKKSEG